MSFPDTQNSAVRPRTLIYVFSVPGVVSTVESRNNSDRFFHKGLRDDIFVQRLDDHMNICFRGIQNEGKKHSQDKLID